MQQGREFDARYNSHLSDDALPALVSAFSTLNSEDQQVVLWSIAVRNCRKSTETDIRSWNFSRWKAAESLEPYNETLKGVYRQCNLQDGSD